MKRAFRLTVLVLAGYGAYALWNRYGSRIGEHAEQTFRNQPGPSVRQIRERSELTASERAAGSDDPVAQATAILADSDERARLSATEDGIERRRSEDTVEL